MIRGSSTDLVGIYRSYNRVEICNFCFGQDVCTGGSRITPPGCRTFAELKLDPIGTELLFHKILIINNLKDYIIINQIFDWKSQLLMKR